MIKMKSFKIMGFGPRKSKSGFTLIELLIVMVIIAILAGVIVMAVGGVFGTAKSTAYSTAREQIQNAVVAYEAANSGSLPTTNGATIVLTGNGSLSTTVINMSLLLASSNPTGGTLRIVPDGCWGAGNNSNPADNCYGNATMGCKTSSHYVWVVDSTSSVYSICTNSGGGTACSGVTANTTNGFGTVWP